MQPQLEQAFLQVSLAGFAVQRTIEVFADPISPALVMLLGRLPGFKSLLKSADGNAQKRFVMGICSFVLGLLISSLAHIRVLVSLGIFKDGYFATALIDVLFSGLVIAAGTEGANSILKWAQYTKDRAGKQLAVSSDVLMEGPRQRVILAGADSVSAVPGARYSFANMESGPVLRSATVQLIFWGASWADGDGSNGFAFQQAVEAIESLLVSSYLSGLNQYDGILPARLTDSSYRILASEPMNFFSNDYIVAALQGLINQGRVPKPEMLVNPLYVVILPSNVRFEEDGVHGEHFYFLRNQKAIPYAWITHDGSLDTLTRLFAHELVEACANPLGTAWREVDNACRDDGSPCEIGDVCQEQQARVDGVWVQGYWSQQDGICVVPGS